MNLIRKCLLTFIILGLIYEGFGQGKSETVVKNQFTLEEAVQYAIKNGYDVKSKGIDLAVAKKKIMEVIAMCLPQVSGSVAYQHVFEVPMMSLGKSFDFNLLPSGVNLTKQDILNSYKSSDPIALGVANNTTWDVTASWVFFSGDYIVGPLITKVFYEMSKQNLVKSYEDTKESVSISYYMAMIMDENVRILKETQQINDANLKDIIAMGDQGLVEQTGVDQVRIIKSTIDNAVSSLERAAIVSKNLLKFQMGLPIESEIILTDKIDKYTDESFFTSYLGEKFDVTKTMDYQIFEKSLKLQKLSWDREKATFLPSFQAFYKHYEQLKSAKFNFQPKNVTGINISVPIFSSGLRSVRTQQGRLNFEKMKLAQQQTTEALNMQYQNTFNEFQTAFASFVTNKKNMELAKRIFDQTMVKYKEGVSSAMDLNTSENQYLTTQRDYFSALNNLLASKAKLNRLLSKN